MIRNIDKSNNLIEKNLLIKLTDGMVMTLRNLHNRDNEGIPTAKTLAIQRFLRDLQNFGSKLKCIELEKSSIRSKLRQLRIAKQMKRINWSVK